MSENLNEREEQVIQGEQLQADINSTERDETETADTVSSAEVVASEVATDAQKTPKKKLSKKKLGIIGAIAVVIAIVAVIVFMPSKFDKVENECVHIAGSIASGKGYFTIETIPDSWDNMDATVRALMLPSHQKSALEAIKYANEELGFPGVYSDMLRTTALMGRQTEENNKYKVSWTYHPDDGLTVTYSKK